MINEKLKSTDYKIGVGEKLQANMWYLKFTVLSIIKIQNMEKNYFELSKYFDLI